MLNQKSALETFFENKSEFETFSERKSVFETLLEINVNDHVEKKNGFNYLSWPFAWSEVKKKFPNTTYKVYENSDGFLYHTDGKTCWVKTGVTINDLEHIEYLPVMDYRNRSIMLENITSFDVNKTIQRSLTKALARHGLGLYIYAGEDLPEPKTEKISPLKIANLKYLLARNEDQQIYQNILETYKIKNLWELTVKQYPEIINGLDNFKAKKHRETKAKLSNSNAKKAIMISNK